MGMGESDKMSREKYVYKRLYTKNHTKNTKKK